MVQDCRARFIEMIAAFTAAEGLSPIAGRIFALLYFDGSELALGEIAEQLDVSRASVSTNARLLDRMGMLERVERDGDRRDYYRAAPDAFRASMTGMMGRMRGIVTETREIAQAVGASDIAARLDHFIEIHRQVADALETVAATLPEPDRKIFA
ncbi:GbsR/MarR family transcriptional regulator [Roseobacter sp. HKCCA0434]|uniref:GbsR/MarR family transcriptional regulator n=1 Tax=Roseobacter sp. HKCCA0434 TaxID=3079297 RepID=UPI002905BF5F|nr:MarR family transcriptional regulator [Roseobacter sp. HKCCA0434]